MEMQDMENIHDMETVLDLEIILDKEVIFHTLYCQTIGRRKQIYPQTFGDCGVKPISGYLSSILNKSSLVKNSNLNMECNV